MGFWRDEVIDPALDQQTDLAIEEQKAWIARDAGDPRPYYQLAQLYRMRQQSDSARALLLEAVRLNPAFGAAHLALTEMYAVRGDAAQAWHHARLASAAGSPEAVALLERHSVRSPETR